MKRDISIILFTFFVTASLGVSAAYAEWVEGGIPACLDVNRQISPCVVTDGTSGAIVTWADTRSGDGDIYAQLISPLGRLLWDMDGSAVCSKEGNQYPHCSISDGAGGAIIAWVDRQSESPARISLQRIDCGGAILWDVDGIPVCPLSAPQVNPRLVADGAHGAIVVWEDFRDRSWKLYAQNIDADGSRLWGDEGIKISDHQPHNHLLQAIPDGISGAVLFWVTETDEGWTLHAQGLTSDGELRWIEETVVASKPFSSGAHTFKDFSAAADGDGGAFVAWYEGRVDYPTYRIYAQRIDGEGAPRWEPDGLLVYFTGWWCDSPRIVTDGAGGAIVVWEAGEGNTYWQYAQRINSSGATLWKERGLEVCYTANFQNGLRLVSDEGGGAISVWSEERTLGHEDIIAQRIDGDGSWRWTVTGLRICDAGGDQFSPALVADGAGGAIIVWQDLRGGSGQDRIYAQRIDADGGFPLLTKLKSFAALGDGFDIVVEWSLEQAGRDFAFAISRAIEPDTTFREITGARIRRDGMTYAYVDEDLEPATAYRYRIFIRDEEGEKLFFATDPVTTPSLPVTLYQNYPNPFNPQTTIYYYVPGPSRVVIEIYNVSGKRIATVLDAWRERGHHRRLWNGHDAKGDPVASGIYYCMLRTETQSRCCTVVVVR